MGGERRVQAAWLVVLLMFSKCSLSFLFYFSFEAESVCSALTVQWSWNHCRDQAGFKLPEILPPLRPGWVLGLKAWSIMAGFFFLREVEWEHWEHLLELGRLH